jgi:hypothetical protein
MMAAARTSETSVNNYFTLQYSPEDKSELQQSSVRACESGKTGYLIARYRTITIEKPDNKKQLKEARTVSRLPAPLTTSHTSAE